MSVSIIRLAKHRPKACTIQGWVSSLRKQKTISFCHVTDGLSGFQLQTVITPNLLPSELTVGSAVSMEGEFVDSPGPEQPLEFFCSSVKVVGSCALSDYPLSGGHRYDPNTVRQHYHLRAKTNNFPAFLRFRQGLLNNIHGFFQNQGFLHIDPPVMSCADCEGAGETFDIVESSTATDDAGTVGQGSPEATSTDSDHEDADVANSAESDRSYFRQNVHLTVSSQMHLEAMCSGIKQVYSISPVFRAEKNITRHHLAELYLVEAEMAFVDSLARLTKIVEQFVITMAQEMLDSNHEDLSKCLEYHESDTKRVEAIASTSRPFVHLDYNEAIAILVGNKKEFEFEPRHGHSLKKEHERHLVAHCGGRPVFVLNFPTTLKPFYMLANHDRPTTAACFDLLVPDCGEVCGGSLREHNYDILKGRMESEGLDMRRMQWYLDLRKFGHPTMGGFGIGLERYIMYLLGVANIKDTIPFPRWYRHCKM